MLLSKILTLASLYLAMAEALEGFHQGHVHPQRDVVGTLSDLVFDEKRVGGGVMG
ncbi:hypothetical protein IFR05_006585 [Cadophora sp. M221]|nr:hypothetical protein IFR05_006585 [Cadophora sp. M221]